MTILDKDKILNKARFETRQVRVDSLDGEITLRRWSGSERDKWEELVLSRRRGDNDYDQQDLRAAAICLSVRTREGKLMFDYKTERSLLNESLDPEDVDMLWETVEEMNGLGKSKSENTKNSGTSLPEPSSTSLSES